MTTLFPTFQHEFLVRVSYMELYNEELKDLLQPDGPKLKVVDDKKLGPRVVGLHDVVSTVVPLCRTTG